MSTAIDASDAIKEIGARLREELDYKREARHAALYGLMLAGTDEVRVPEVVSDLSTDRLLTMAWLDGEKLMSFKDAPLETRNRIGTAMFKAWWVPFSHYGVIHGDPHLGNYTVRSETGPEGAEVRGINLLDYGCIRIFPPKFVAGVVDLYEGLRHDDQDRIVHAYETWGFKNLSRPLIDTLNIWARFIYGPILDDRVRTVANGVEPGQYGRREAFQVHQALKALGGVKVPREFVFMDRAAVGLGAVFPAPQGGTELLCAVQRGDRRLRQGRFGTKTGRGSEYRRAQQLIQQLRSFLHAWLAACYAGVCWSAS